MLQEFKPRKAKYGFKVEEFLLGDIQPTAKLLEGLTAHGVKPSEYSVEFGVPFRARDIKFKIYTDDDSVADFIRKVFTLPVLPKI
jgi:hypothetical protein